MLFQRERERTSEQRSERMSKKETEEDGQHTNEKLANSHTFYKEIMSKIYTDPTKPSNPIKKWDK